MRSLETFDAVILAGGLGNRLRRLVSDRSKVLAKVDGRPFIFYLLDQLCEAGFRRVILCTGYMGEHLEEFIGKTYRSLHIVYSREEVALGTGGALRHAAKIIREDSILVMNGDSFVDIDLLDFISWHLEKQSNWSITVMSVTKPDGFGVVELSSNDGITGFFEKRQTPSDHAVLINAGVYLTNKIVIQSLPNKKTFSLEHDYLPQLISNNVFGYKTGGAFIDIGTPESYLLATQFFRSIRDRKTAHPS